MTKITSQTITVSSRGPLYIFIAALLWSTAGFLIKYVPWHPMAISCGRSFVAAVFVSLYYRKKIWQWPNRTTLISGISLALTQTIFIIANKMTTAANAIMLQYISPVFIIIIGLIIFHIRPTKREIVAVVFTFIGILLFFIDDLNIGNQIGNALALFSGFTMALVFIANNRQECQSATAFLLAQIGSFFAGLPFLSRVENVLPNHLLVMMILGIFQLGISYILFNKGIRMTSPLNASMISMVEPIMSPVWVFIFLGEKPGLMALFGAIIVITTIVYLNIGNYFNSNIRTVGKSDPLAEKESVEPAIS